MPGSGLGYLLSALTGGVSGYVNQKNKQDQLELQKKNAEREALAKKAEMYAKGLATGPDGNFIPAEGYDPEGLGYFGATAKRAYDAKEGKEIPVEGTLPGQLASLFPQGSKIREGERARLLEKFIGSSSKPQATQDQIDQYKKYTGLDPTGLTPAQIQSQVASIIAQQGRQEGIDDRFKKNFNLKEEMAKFIKESTRDRIEETKKSRLDQNLQKFYDDLAKSGIPEVAPLFKSLDEETGIISGKNKNLEKLPGVGTNVARGVPLVGDTLGFLTSKTYGGGKAYQALQGLMNIRLKSRSGAAVTKYEQGRQMVEAGMSAGSEKDVENGVKLMLEGFKEHDRSLRSAYGPDVMREYEARGGQRDMLSEILGQTEGQKSTGGMVDVIEVGSGRPGKIPQDKIDAALKSGKFKRVK